MTDEKPKRKPNLTYEQETPIAFGVLVVPSILGERHPKSVRDRGHSSDSLRFEGVYAATGVSDAPYDTVLNHVVAASSPRIYLTLSLICRTT